MAIPHAESQINHKIIDWYLSRDLTLIRIASTGIDARKRPLDKWTSKRVTRDWLIAHAERGHNLGWHIGPDHLVIDIDPRNGGEESLEALQEEIGYRLEDKYITIYTGGDGLHFYTKLKGKDRELLTKSKNYPGIDLLTGNRQVIIPGSRHPSGQLYEFADRPLPPQEIPPIDRKIITVFSRQQSTNAKSSPPSSSLEEVAQILEHLDPPAEYDDWINHLGAIYHATGGDGLELAIEWSMKDPIYAEEAEEQVRRRWDSFAKPHPNPRTIKTLINSLSKVETPEAEKIVSEHFFKSTIDDFKDERPNAYSEEGLKELLEEIDRLPPNEDKSVIVDLITDALYRYPFSEHEIVKRARKSLGVNRDQFQPVLKKIREKVRTTERSLKRAKEKKRNKIDIDVITNELIKTKYEDEDGNRILLHATNQQYYYYSGSIWEPGLQNAIDQAAYYASLKYIKENNLNVEVTTAAKRIEVSLKAKVTTTEDLLRFHQPPPSVVNTKNHELHIDRQTGRIDVRDHSPLSYLTTQIDVEFDPFADCPAFDEMLDQVFAHFSKEELSQIKRHFFELVGYVIQPAKNIPLICLWYGDGFNGKTTIANFIAALVGDKAVLPAKLHEFGGKGNAHALASLEGKLLLVDDDLQANMVLSDGIAKKISEAKAIEVNPKNKPAYTIVSTVTPLLLGNNLPIVRDISRGMQRRFDLIPFTSDLTPHKDSPLPKIAMNEELPGILNAALDGLQRLRERGEFDPPPSCVRARERFFAQSNSVSTWIADECEWNPEAVAPLRDLYDSYKLYCVASAERVEPLSRWRRMLEQLGADVSKATVKRVRARL